MATHIACKYRRGSETCTQVRGRYLFVSIESGSCIEIKSASYLDMKIMSARRAISEKQGRARC